MSIINQNAETQNNISKTTSGSIKQPLISITIPVYNSEKHLPAALDSLIAQTYQNLEVIIINNGSSGNVNEIFEDYCEIQPYFHWKIINLTENVGLFHARVKGFEVSSGEYFATMDSDDTVSVDFYYQLLIKAQSTGADMVLTDYVNNVVEGEKSHYALNPVELIDFCWEGEDCLTNFFKFHGACFNLHADWVKIYHKDLWEASKDAIYDIVVPLVLNEDIVFSTIFFAYAKKIVNTHGVYYYHAIYPEAASSEMAANEKKFLSGIQNQKDSFDAIERFLHKIGRFEEMKLGLTAYREFLYGVLFINLKYNDMTSYQRNCLQKKALRILELKSITDIHIDYDFFQKADYFQWLTSPFCDDKENALRKIKDPAIKYVSFDIFDTLVERPFLQPDDLFELLSIKMSTGSDSIYIVNYAEMRRRSEQLARERVIRASPFRREVRLNEIYEEMQQRGWLSKEQAERAYSIELELELKFCKPRTIGKELYDFALRQGKKVICTSDMYLTKAQVWEILRKCGYDTFEEVFVSSEEQACKYDGKLHAIVLKKLNVKANQLLHIGDNYQSDIIQPEKLGIPTLYVSASAEMLKNQNTLSYTGHSFMAFTGNEQASTAPVDYLGMRCIAGLIKNKMFSNPFVKFEKESEFNANLTYMGYYALGTYIFAIARWLMRIADEEGYATIHFIARDGYLIKQAYDTLVQNSGSKHSKSNYLYVSRKAMLPLMITCQQDVMPLKDLLDIHAYSPEKILMRLKDIVPKAAFEKRLYIFQSSGIIPDRLFEKSEEWNCFVTVFLKHFYCQQTIDDYRRKLKESFAGEIGSHDCTFDAGYSARTETIFSTLLGIKLDACYLYCSLERARRLANRHGINIRTFHHESANTSLIYMTEAMLCTSGPSLELYDLSHSGVELQFEPSPHYNFQTRFTLQCMQNAAIDFVKDMVSTYREEWERFVLRDEDLSEPFKFFLYETTDFDRRIFAVAELSDTDAAYHTNTLYYVWRKLTSKLENATEKFMDIDVAWIQYGAKWKKAIFYFLYNRKEFKEKVKTKFRNRPLLLKMMKLGYSIPRGIYHIFKRK